MKKKVIIINVLLSMAVLFSILFQAIHSYEHHSEQLAAKHYSHPHSKNKTEISNLHKIQEKCVVCHFNFSSSTIPTFSVFRFYENKLVPHYPKFYFQKNYSFFKGSLFSLRAPPIF